MDHDVIVLGTGAAGLTAAISAHDNGARVGLFEKAQRIGGTSAWSGGQIWIPDNPHQKERGREDSRERSLTYLRALSHGLISDEMAAAFIDGAREMVDFLEQAAPMQFYCVADFPDYHPELPGGKPEGGRTLECPPYPYGELGSWADLVEISPYFPDIHIAVAETTLGQAIAQEIPADIKRQRVENDERGLGHALIGRLLRGCLDRGIEPQPGWRAVELLRRDGIMEGVRFETMQGDRTCGAANVILATGGFEWDDSFVRAFLRGPMTHPVSVRTNSGDGLRMAMRAGAMLGNMREAWWAPVIEVPETMVWMGRQLMSAARGLPGTIIVNRHGKRFMNEAANYNAAGAAFHEQDTASSSYRNLPCWLIFDAACHKRYGIGGGVQAAYAGGTDAPRWIIQAASLTELAAKLKIDAGIFTATVERFNVQAAAGKDEDFHRGDSAHDRWWGDPRFKGSKAATLGTIGEGPYYALPLHSGCLGTKGGPQTDIHARVVDLDGKPIDGLYAAGNVMASPMGMTYGGAGGTLGPAMAFGYLAGKHAAGRVKT